MIESEWKNLGRNDRCHCGSGKKYKQCCLSKDEEAARKARLEEEETQPQEAESASPQAPEPPRVHERRHATAQPWRKTQGPRNMPRFSAPRKIGGS